jgi:hypothetical protein
VIVKRSGFALALLAVAATARPARAEAAAPAVKLTVTPGTNGGPWAVRVANEGELPVRLTADVRLLSMELTAPDQKKRVELRCVLPEDARPQSDDGRELVIPGKRSWSQVFDPFFFCFGPKERAALVTGTVIKARFGWKPPRVRPGAKPVALAPPFAIAPVGAAIGQLTPLKELEAVPVTLGEAVKVAAGTGAEGTAPALTLTLPDALDASRGVELGTTVTVANSSERAVTLLLRPDTLAFTVSGPAGSVSCGTPKQVASPIRESFTTLGPKGRSQVSLLLTAVCPSGTFDEPGAYRVFPRIDTRTASGRPIGLKTWDDEASGRTPMLLRIRTPRRPTVATKPALD